ncbi:MAG: threonine/serine exporter family protein [Bacillota bacterium]|jgi:uncharacterized membrane protein YjjP (DUF1212 family)
MLTVNDRLGSLLDLGLYAGRLLLESGAEVYRTEDTLDRMLRAAGAEMVDSIVTPTGIFLSVHYGGLSGTRIGRVRSRGTNLKRVAAINSLSRALSPGNSPPTEVLQKLRSIEERTGPEKLIWQLAAAMVGGATFSWLFGASRLELLGSALASGLVFLLSTYVARPRLPRILADFTGGAIASSAALSLTVLFPTMLYERVVLGAIMTLVPGVSLTTAVRDMLSGDLLSGTTGLGEALFIAAAIAAGAGAVLSLYGPAAGSTFAVAVNLSRWIV